MLCDIIFVVIGAIIASIVTPIAMRYLPMPDIQWSIDSSPVLTPRDITTELYREYDWPARDTPYRIQYPQELYVGTTTHRIIDSARVVHCVPAPGYHGCVLRWVARPGEKPVVF